jgi:hypothetical protein
MLKKNSREKKHLTEIMNHQVMVNTFDDDFPNHHKDNWQQDHRYVN